MVAKELEVAVTARATKTAKVTASKARGSGNTEIMTTVTATAVRFAGSFGH